MLNMMRGANVDTYFQYVNILRANEKIVLRCPTPKPINARVKESTLVIPVNKSKIQA